MICKILNQNYSLRHYLPETLIAFLAVAIMVAGPLGLTGLKAIAADSPRIINGNAEDEDDDHSCSEADLINM